MSVFLGAIDKGLKIKYRLGKPYKEFDSFVQEVVVDVRGRNYIQYDYSSKKETLIKRYKKYPFLAKSMFKFIS